MLGWWSKRRLHTQLVLASASLLTVTVLATTWYSIKLQQQELLGAFERDARSLAGNIAATSSYLLVTDKLDELETLLIRAIGLPELTLLRVISPAGEPLSHVVKNAEGRTLAVYQLGRVTPPFSADLLGPEVSIDLGQERLQLWYPIRTSNLLGWLELEMSLATLSSLEETILKESSRNGLIALCFDIALLLLILRIPAESFRRALRFAEQLVDSPGQNLRQLGGAAELTDLAESLNRTSAKLRSHEHIIEERNRSLAALNESLERKVEERTNALSKTMEDLRLLSLAIEQSPSAIIVADSDKRISMVNPGFVATYGYRPHETIGRRPSFLSTDDTPKGLYQEMWSELESGGYWQGELRNQRKDGEKIWVFMTISVVRDNAGNVKNYLAVQDNITERKEHEQILVQQANFDGLTGLPNRALLEDRLAQALRHDARNRKQTALLYLDLDKFKPVNDTFGHGVGDALLIQTGERLRQAVRAEDTVARLGGDEFLMVLSGVSDTNAISKVAHKIQVLLQKPFLINGQELQVGSSLGIAIAPRDGITLDALLSNADSAMYRAKQQGTNRHQYFTNELNELATRRLKIRNELHHAVTQQQLKLVFQPIVCLEDRRIVATEALLRWNSSTLGEVEPEEFVPIAEESGLIAEIGEWVLKNACVAAYQFHQDFGCAVSVNLSCQQLQGGGFARKISQLMRDHNLPPSQLHIELTEGVFFEDSERVRSEIEALNKLGIELAIDDFGTGYSSLSYLKRFSCAFLKVDRCFVADLCESADSQAIVTAIIQLAHSLGMRVIAEGVETQAQMEKLTALQCDLVQGYYLAPPLSWLEFTRYATELARHSG